MTKLINRVGIKYSRLTVIEQVLGTKRSLWKCVCECGRESLVSGCNLATGRTKSCGCLSKEVAKTRKRCNPGLVLYKGWDGKMKKYPTKEEILELFYYSDGNLIRKKNSGPAKAGELAGTVKKNGYVYVSINNSLHLLHRLIWILFNDYDSELPIDHIDKDRSNSRIENLRSVSSTCNNRNSIRQTGQLGIRGVSPYINRGRDTGKFAVKVSVGNRSRHLGYYDTCLDACYARFAAEQCLDWLDCDTDSSAYNYIKENS